MGEGKAELNCLNCGSSEMEVPLIGARYAGKQLLICSRCGDLLRPHVLWFDESYNEAYYRFESSLAAANRTDLLIIVGTSGATNLPNQVAWLVYQNGGTIIDINLERNPFTELAESSPEGAFIQGQSAVVLPEIAEILTH